MEKILYTIGHSTYPLEDFLRLLAEHDIQVLVDVRSSPYTRYATHFNGPMLKISLQNTAYKYLFLGDELGGKPKESEFYDQEGFLRYDWLSSSERFRSGIERLLTGMEKYRIALMCGEEDPAGCHRHLLVGRVLSERGIKLRHIRKGGRLHTSEDLIDEDEKLRRENQQLTLFSAPVDIPWRSAKAIQKQNNAEG